MINKQVLKSIFDLNRNLKISVVILLDISLCIFTVWLAFYLRLEQFILPKNIYFIPILISIFLFVPTFWIFGLYRTLFRFGSISILSKIGLSCFVYGVFFFIIFTIYGVQNVPRTIGIIQPILLLLAILSSRSAVRYLLNYFLKNVSSSQKRKEKILIYGAGDAGRQLLLSLENTSQYDVIGFLDDNTQLHGQFLLGKKVYNPNKLDTLKITDYVNLILFAIPSINRSKKIKIIENLIKYKLVVKTLPNLNDLIDGKVSVSDLRDFLVDDLLNREAVEPDKKLLNANIASKTVLVTGAGGTIGSELAYQIIKLAPKQLILIELNEFALYKIYEDLIAINKNLKIVPIICNIQDQKKLELIFKKFSVNTIYHTAAYKHVPIVEANICEGVKNNVFGTLAVAKASISQKVESLVLISSDKAVRPTNIMGASKRFAELCMQGLHNVEKNQFTNFSIVRFGNVINSSGSVVPKFKRQIKEGGPITLTHPEVTRYFMTIYEAAQLVIQAGSLGKNSEVFILDMGESVKIIDLINKIIEFSGLTIKNKDNPNGDIEIQIIGLRPGEKLYEELLIGNNPQKTPHPKIKKTDEPYLDYNKLEKILNELSEYLKNEQSDKVKKILSETIKSYNSNTELVDHLFTEDNKSEYNLLPKNKIDNVIKIK